MDDPLLAASDTLSLALFLFQQHTAAASLKVIKSF